MLIKGHWINSDVSYKGMRCSSYLSRMCRLIAETGKKRARNRFDYRLLMAQRVGFEPTCDCSQTDFESAPL